SWRNGSRAATSADLRQAMAQGATDDQPVQPPYGGLARQIGEAAYKVTDEQVAEVVEATGSQRATYELIIAAAVGAGLCRWERGQEALKTAIPEVG
ncbi:MAG: hypothetical protein ACRDQW_15075, partial [Haloechinothrix sp.]